VRTLIATFALLGGLLVYGGEEPVTRVVPESVRAPSDPAGVASLPVLGEAAENEVIDRYCVSCHSERRLTGNLSLESFDAEHPEGDAELAEKMVVKLRADMMPPPGSRRPAGDTLEALVEALEIPVVGNGDIRTGEDARRMREETGCHGIMMARGTHGAPWLFTQARAALEGLPIPAVPDAPERFRICLRHARNAIQYGGEARRAAIEFRKHLGWYTKGLEGGKRLREELFHVTTLEEMEEILSGYLAARLAGAPSS